MDKRQIPHDFLVPVQARPKRNSLAVRRTLKMMSGRPSDVDNDLTESFSQRQSTHICSRACCRVRCNAYDNFLIT